MERLGDPHNGVEDQGYDSRFLDCLQDKFNPELTPHETSRCRRKWKTC